MIQRWFCAILLVLKIGCAFGQTPYENMPFSTKQSDFTVWNGDTYTPFFIKGVNLGISKPGTFPGELAASKEDYSRWLGMIQEAGFNTIRLYTLHNPHFYQVLDSFNKANPNRPIYFFQGIWLEEEIVGYNEDLYMLTNAFIEELQGNISAVHGDADLDPRPGKASGEYTKDVSKYMLGYIIGREIHPPEVYTTNSLHAIDIEYNGTYLSISNATPSEVWITELLDKVIVYEKLNYEMMHPVSFSSWPTLDPLHHPDESNRYEDSVTIDLNKMDITNAPAGYFASYHAYPYYPDFVSSQPSYTNSYDYLGQNSYLGYLKDLKNHYKNIPLVIAEFGASSSWGIAHYSHSGIHHGGSSEVEQGEAYLRMFRNLQEAGIAGGMQFAWIDEWFKRTWITDPLDYTPGRRILWQNITASEQNFGLLGYRKQGDVFDLKDSICSTCQITEIEAGADYSFFNLKLSLGGSIDWKDTLWIAFDTYADSLGESILPNGDSINHRAEFCLMLTQDQATLFVTQAYDLFGIWHDKTSPEQKYRSTKTDGAPWQLVRWKNNNTINEVQYIGRLGVNRLNLPLKSTDAVIIKDEYIQIRLPWTLLQFIDPSEKIVMHDDRSTSTKEDTISTGIAIDLIYNQEIFSSSSRYAWTNWQKPTDLEEYKKQSYTIVANELEEIPSAPIAHADTFTITADKKDIDAVDGVLKNDISFSALTSKVYIVESTYNGLIQLQSDGSFNYQPIQNFSGKDSFTYILKAGKNWSVPVSVRLEILPSLSASLPKNVLTLYPNPSKDYVYFESTENIEKVELFNGNGVSLQSKIFKSSQGKINLKAYSAGVYFIRVTTKKGQAIHRIVKN